MCLGKGSLPIDSVRHQIAQGIDFIVHLGRIKGKGRKVLEIAEICDFRDDKYLINTIFKYDINNGLVKTENELINNEKLELANVLK